MIRIKCLHTSHYRGFNLYLFQRFIFKNVYQYPVLIHPLLGKFYELYIFKRRFLMAKNLYFFELLLSIHLFNLLIEHASSRGLGLGHRDLLTDLRVRLNFCPAPTLPRTPLRWSRSRPATTKTLGNAKEIDFLNSRSLWYFHFIYHLLFVNTS